jgi:hypothetical protein
MDLTMMERVRDRWEKMEGSCLTGQSPQWALVPVEEEYNNVGKIKVLYIFKIVSILTFLKMVLVIVPINCKNFEGGIIIAVIINSMQQSPS